MKYVYAKRVAWTGLASLGALLAAPLGCGSSSDGGSSSSGAGVGAGAAAGASAAGAGPSSAAGQSQGGGGPAGAGAANVGGASGQAGAAQAGAGNVAGASGASAGAGGGSAGTPNNGGAFDGSKCTYTNDKDFCACLGATCGGDTLNDQSKAPQSVYCGQCASAQTCVGFASPAGGALGTCQDLGGLTDAQKAQAAALTSVWENSTPVLAYGYAEDIRDYRGVTAGRAGFCSGTGDGIVVVQCISAIDPSNPLAKYVPALIGIEKTFVAANGDLKTAANSDKLGNLTGLGMTENGNNATGGYADAWKQEGSNADFKKCQDSVVDAVYYGPALKKVHDKKFSKALTIVSLWDAQLEQGESDPTFGMQKMMADADAVVKLSDPPTAQEESDWLGAFHKIRATIMKNYPEWQDNNFRVAIYEMIRLSGDMDFKNCVNTGAKSAADYWPGLSNAKGDAFTICTGGQVTSGN